METPATKPSAPQTERKSETFVVPFSERAAYSPAEFAALFGRKKTWTYRQLYAGRVKGIAIIGQIMIPRTEAERLTSLATEYNPDPARAPKQRKAAKAEAGL